LTDVDTTGVQTNSIIVYDGANWVDAADVSIAANGVATFSNTFNASATANFTKEVNITAGSSVTIPLEIRAAASQTANLTEWENSSGTTLSYINKEGDFYGHARDVEIRLYMEVI
jgi:hypothetical protein